MTEITGEALSIAGFTLAHAVWSICDGPEGDLLCPLAIVADENGTRKLTRYQAPTQADAIEQGKADYAINSATNEAWAFAREGTYRTFSDAPPHDIITVDFWSNGMPYVASLMQRYGRNATAPVARGFHLDGVPSIIDNGVLLGPTEGVLMVDRVKQGIAEHPEAERLWRYWE